MAELLGATLPGIPSVDITGFFSSSWIWIAVAVGVGAILIGIVSLLMFLTTYNKKIVVFENISGQGYQPVLKTRARIVKLGIGGEELLKTMKGGHFVSAYGRKMGKNTYWFAKGQDGYWYNIVLGDLETKRAMLDIDPIDRDVRMFHVALDRLSHQTYGKQSFLDKYVGHIMLLLFLVVLILGIWFIVGKIGDATAPLAISSENAVKIQEANDKTLVKLDNILRSMGYINTDTSGGSGLVSAG